MTKTAAKTAARDPLERISDITFRDPPIPVRYDWEKIAAKLKKRPMKWALIFEADRVSKVNAIREGRVPSLHPDLGFDVRTTNNQRTAPRVCDLYLRYNPEHVKVTP